MTKSQVTCIFAFCAMVMTYSKPANGQSTYPNSPQVSRATAAMHYFSNRGGGDNIRTLIRRQMPTPQHAQHSNAQSAGKPFQDVIPQPTLSPYLTLDAINDDNSLPNYHTLVRPLLEERQELQKQVLRQQRQRKEDRIASSRGNLTRRLEANIPTTGSSGQFMNMGSYYPMARK